MAPTTDGLNESLLEVGDSLDSLSIHINNKAVAKSSRNAILAACIVGIGSFTFGYSLGMPTFFK
jgi:hypothetical protein